VATPDLASRYSHPDRSPAPKTSGIPFEDSDTPVTISAPIKKASSSTKPLRISTGSGPASGSNSRKTSGANTPVVGTRSRTGPLGNTQEIYGKLDKLNQELKKVKKASGSGSSSPIDPPSVPAVPSVTVETSSTSARSNQEEASSPLVDHIPGSYPFTPLIPSISIDSPPAKVLTPAVKLPEYPGAVDLSDDGIRVYPTEPGTPESEEAVETSLALGPEDLDNPDNATPAPEEPTGFPTPEPVNTPVVEIVSPAVEQEIMSARTVITAEQKRKAEDQRRVHYADGFPGSARVQPARFDGLMPNPWESVTTPPTLRPILPYGPVVAPSPISYRPIASQVGIQSARLDPTSATVSPSFQPYLLPINNEEDQGRVSIPAVPRDYWREQYDFFQNTYPGAAFNYVLGPGFDQNVYRQDASGYYIHQSVLDEQTRLQEEEEKREQKRKEKQAESISSAGNDPQASTSGGSGSGGDKGKPDGNPDPRPPYNPRDHQPSWFYDPNAPAFPGGGGGGYPGGGGGGFPGGGGGFPGGGGGFPGGGGGPPGGNGPPGGPPGGGGFPGGFPGPGGGPPGGGPPIPQLGRPPAGFPGPYLPWDPNVSMHWAQHVWGALNGIGGNQDDSRAKLREPTPFDGTDPTALRTFQFSCELIFTSKPESFRTARKKVLYGLSYMEGSARSYFANQLDNGFIPAWMDDWDLFMVEAQINFGALDPGRDAARELSALRMTNADKVTDYTIKFNNHASITQWNESALNFRYYEGLAPRLQMAIAGTPGGVPTNLDHLKSLARNLDAQYWAAAPYRQAQRAQNHQPHQQGHQQHQYTPTHRMTAPHQYTSATSAPTASAPTAPTGVSVSVPPNSNVRVNTARQDTSRGSAPSRHSRSGGPSSQWGQSLGRFANKVNDHLSPEERQRRLSENACFLCGEKGHYSNTCPKRESISALRATGAIKEEEEIYRQLAKNH
jgi:hypothetical protein